jgi:hypothetical protein
MKLKMIVFGLLAVALSGLTANACWIQIRVACPNDRSAAGVEICIVGSEEGCVLTDDQGIALIHVPVLGTYTATVTESTLPPDATLSPLKQNIKVVTDTTTYAEFILGGNFCSTPPPPGPCWLTGGGTIGRAKGAPNYSFGGVVYPGCSPKAADGGNWNVVDHFSGRHFQGQQIFVDSCSGVSTKSPKVNVNIIDFHGLGIIEGLGIVSFIGRGIDNLESGGGSIVNVASFVALMGAATAQIAYTASKGGVLSMTRELAVEYARQGIRANALCPGPIETPLLSELLSDPARRARRMVHIPMGRLGRAEELAKAALFLASDDASFMTGAALVVDGGITAAYVTPE